MLLFIKTLFKEVIGLNKKYEIINLSKKRLSICNSCIYNSKNFYADDNHRKSFIKKIISFVRKDSYCILCSCNIKLKTKCKECHCDMNKW